MTWEIVVGLITLLSAVIAICTIVANNTKALTEIRCSIDELNRSTKAQNSSIVQLQAAVEDLGTRLLKLEVKEGMQ